MTDNSKRIKKPTPPISKPCLLAVLFILFVFGCNDNLNSIDKSLIRDAVKLNSPYSGFSLYRYHIESPMAFGSGFTVLQILSSDEKCDYTNGDFFRFGNNYPFFIKWKNKDTISVKCFIDGGELANKQPIKKEIQKWKDWTFEVEYYSVYSSGTGGDYSIKSYKVNSNFMKFNADSDLLSFSPNETLLELDSTKIFLTSFKVDTFNSKTGLSLIYYKLLMDKNYNISDFKLLQPFIVTKP